MGLLNFNFVPGFFGVGKPDPKCNSTLPEKSKETDDIHRDVEHVQLGTKTDVERTIQFPTLRSLEDVRDAHSLVPMIMDRHEKRAERFAGMALTRGQIHTCINFSSLHDNAG